MELFIITFLLVGLAFAGIAMEKPQLTQVAAGLEQAKQQQEKQ